MQGNSYGAAIFVGNPTSSPGPFVIIGTETKSFRLRPIMTRGPGDEVVGNQVEERAPTILV